MDELLQVWSRIAWAQSWQVTLLIAGVWLVLRAVGRNRPHLACALWLVVLLKCITPPLVSSPSGIFCWLQRAEPAVKVQSVLAATEAEFVPLAASQTDAIVVRASPVVAAPLAARAAAVDLPAAGEVSAEPASQAIGSWSLVMSLAAFAWLIGVLVFAAVATAQWLACWRKLARAGRIDEAPLAKLVDDLRQRLKLRRSVQLLVTESSLGPAVVGLLQPTIILPAILVRVKTPEELAPLVAHELIHIRRGDLWIGMLQTLAVASWWFHPLVRLASRLITREAERCCDEETIAHLGCEPAAYARSLLDVLALKQELTPIPAFPGVRPVDVTSQRLERIMQLGQGCHKRTPWWCWLIMLAAAAAVLPGAALVVGAKEKPKPRPGDPQQYVRPDFPLAAEEPDGKAAELTTRTYDVADLIAPLAQQMDEPEHHARLLLAQLVQWAGRGPLEKESESAGRDALWDADKLVVRQTDDAHRRIAEQLAVLREHGHAQIAVEVRIISGPMVAMLNAEGVNWRMIGSRRAAQPSPAGEAVSVVEKNVPAMLSLISQREATKFLTEAQQHPKTNVIQAPKVTLFNGHSARVEDSVQRPFVVGVTPAADGKTTILKPTIRVFSEGTSIRLRPVAKKDGSIQLDFGLTLSQIRDVETAEFPTGPGKQPITVQVPEVASTRLSTTVEMNAEQSLLLAIPKTGKGKKVQPPMAVLVTVRRIPEPAAVDLDDGDGARTMNLHPGGWRFELRPRQGHRLRIACRKQDSDRVDFGFTTGLRIEAVTSSSEVTNRISLEGAKANVRMASGRESAEDQELFFEIELSDEVSGACGETKFRADRLQLTVEDPYVDSGPRSSQPRSSQPRKPSPMRLTLDGNVQLSHDGSRIEARRAVLRINEPFVPQSDAGRKATGVQIEVDDAKAIDVPSRNYHPNEVQYFPPGPEHSAAKFIEKIYPVADLVIPLPSGPIQISPTGSQLKRESPEVIKPDFDSLIDLISTTIRPDSWDRVGAKGEISVATNSYSLVIRQDEQVHKMIGDLLRQLRRLQDIQVVLTLERLEVSAAELAAAVGKTADSPLTTVAENLKLRAWCLKPEFAAMLKRLPTARVQPGPKLTAFNGQTVGLPLRENGDQIADIVRGLLVQPLVTADFRSLRLQIFADAAADPPHVADNKSTSPYWLTATSASPRRALHTEHRELVLGQVLVVDQSKYAWQEGEKGVPVDDKAPGEARLFKGVSAKKPDTRCFYLITPNVLVASEEKVLAPRQK
ncbi:MAG TPA: M56 family metallopeptidase [Pirellulaceae bacterium]|nr:M56 family metallopeptidase [Pirellulaceae bacterium]